MGTKRLDKDDIFHAAAEMADADERAAYIQQACGDDVSLRAEIEALLKHDSAEDSLLDRSALGIGATLDQPITEKPGTTIGRYKLREQIGEGGFGVVFMAEQQEPVTRMVALKVLRRNVFESREAVLAEARAAAKLNHPHVCTIYAVAEIDGLPVIAMEYLDGRPLSQIIEQGL